MKKGLLILVALSIALLMGASMLFAQKKATAEKEKGSCGKEMKAPGKEMGSCGMEMKLTDEQKQWIQPLSPFALAWSAMWFEFNRLVMRGVFRVRAVGIENLPASTRLYLIRKTPDREVMEWLVGANDILSGKTKDIPVQAGDVLATEDMLKTARELLGL